MSERFGRYRADSLLGRGAMGTVYRGHDPDLDRTVAIKVMSPSDVIPQASRDEFRERFLREARSAAKLNQPNIVAVYDVGVADDGRPFLVMELVPGASLAARLEAGDALPPEAVASIGEEIALALGCAHDAEIIHRDVKPANILVTDEGDAKLMDFGIARIAESTLTSHGQFLGSPMYASPEQIKGLELTAQSDLFSLGLTLFTAVAKKHPFRKDKWPATARAIVQDPMPALAEVAPGLDPAWEVVLGQAMAKAPDERFADAAELAATLASLRRGDLLGSASATPASVVELVVEQGPDRGRVIPLTDTVEVGRGRGDLALSDDTVSSRHATFIGRAGGVELRDLGSSNGTFVDETRVTQTQLAPGALVRLGNHTLVRLVQRTPGTEAGPPGPTGGVTGTVLDGGQEAAAPRVSLASAARFVLHVDEGARRGVRLPIGARLVLSRDEGPGRLDDAKVSRKHALIEVRPGSRVYLRDLASSNGTWIDEQRVREVELRVHDSFRIGDTTLRLERAQG